MLAVFLGSYSKIQVSKFKQGRGHMMVSQTPFCSNPQAASRTNPTTAAEQRTCVGTTQQYESPDALMSQSVDTFGEERNFVTL